MPYESPADIPATVRRVLPPRAQRIWMEAFNSAVYDQGADDAKGARIAWG
ncbi:MAG: ChaB family protein, partial [Alphaproteobacteria bacterium]